MVGLPAATPDTSEPHFILTSLSFPNTVAAYLDTPLVELGPDSDKSDPPDSSRSEALASASASLFSA